MAKSPLCPLNVSEIERNTNNIGNGTRREKGRRRRAVEVWWVGGGGWGEVF